MKKLILKNSLSPGDLVMLTAAVRDLHKCYPDQYRVDVRTPCRQIWENNPYITPIDDDDPEALPIDCQYPLINSSNSVPKHFIFGFIENLNQQLGIQISPTLFRGDIHLSSKEKGWYSQIREMTGEDTPFWIIVAGGKFDFTIKWWEHSRFQEVVDHFRGKIIFVQVGESKHHHPGLKGVIDLRGKTNMRQLIRLVYHSQGVLCPVTSLMHLAAAVETKGGKPKNRPCIVVAGGREPSQWEAYPHHQFIHTNGALPCCEQGGCWKSRITPLGDGDPKDLPQNLCHNQIDGLPKCMDMISAEDVIRRIELYYRGGVLQWVTGDQYTTAEPFISF